LVKSGKYLKLPLGPIISPRPGPTLEREVAAAEMAVVKSRLLKDKRAVRRKKIKIYKKIKVNIDVKKVSPTISPRYFIGKTPLG
jgi:hypothetical protein